MFECITIISLQPIASYSVTTRVVSKCYISRPRLCSYYKIFHLPFRVLRHNLEIKNTIFKLWVIFFINLVSNTNDIVTSTSNVACSFSKTMEQLSSGFLSVFIFIHIIFSCSSKNKNSYYPYAN